MNVIISNNIAFAQSLIRNLHLTPNDCEILDRCDYSSPLPLPAQKVFIDCEILGNRIDVPEFKVETVVFLSPKDECLKLFLKNRHIAHFVSKDEDYIRLLLSPRRHDSNLGLERYFAKDSIITFGLQRYSQKNQCFDVVEKTLARSHHFQGLKDFVLTAAAELLMNAFFDAAVDTSSGERLFVNRSRTEDIVLPNGAENLFSCAYEGPWFGICLQDPFGSLSREKLVESLKRASELEGESQFRSLKAQGGAGVGLYMLYRGTCALVFRVVPNKLTSVSCFFRITKQQKIYESIPKSIQFFEEHRQ